MQFEADTGADTNLLSLDLYHKLYPNATVKALQRTQVCISLPIIDTKYSTLVYAHAK